MKRAVSFFGLLIVLNFPISCDVGCGDFKKEKPSIIVNFSSEIGSYYDNYFRKEESTDFMVAAIRLNIDSVEYINVLASIINPFMSTAVAFHCEPAPPNPTQALSEISITSDQNISHNGTEFKSGDNLNELFIISRYRYIEISIENFLKDKNDIGSSFGHLNDYLIFRFATKPNLPISQKFTFRLTFSDGAVFEVESPIFIVDN
ncbi:MAG: hypothetical protein L3J29_06005 [Cyclobacteriaceae bacterium]|nr:hypothetical protein [Cyclobacteriaceae bacterium]